MPLGRRRGTERWLHCVCRVIIYFRWFKEDELEVTFEVVDEVRESDRTPEVLAALNATFSYYGRS